MVLMGVGGDDAQHVLAPLGEKRDIGHDEVDAGRGCLAAEQHAAIDHDPLRVVGRPEAIGVEIHADLARPAQRQEDEFVVTRYEPSRRLRRVAGVDQDQAADGEIGIEMVDRRGLLVEQLGQAAGGDDGHRLAIFRLDARDQALDQPDIAPVDAGLHGGHGVLADHRLGARRSPRAAAGRRPGAAPRRDRLMPGAITPPSKSPFSPTMSKVVAVPKSTTISAPW